MDIPSWIKNSKKYINNHYTLDDTINSSLEIGSKDKKFEIMKFIEY